MLSFIEVLRAVAVALIANSHFKGVYPNDIFSFGGGYGLALFYMISGYLLANLNEKTVFKKWYLRKIIRLYIPLWIVRLFELCLPPYEPYSFRYVFLNFVFPGTWFGGSLLILYAVYYLIVKYVLHNKSNQRLYLSVVICALLYLALFITNIPIARFSIRYLRIEPEFGVKNSYLIAQFVWLVCMLMGYRIRTRTSDFKGNNDILLSALFFISIATFLLVRVAERKQSDSFLELLLGPAYFAFAYSLFIFLSKREDSCKRLLLSSIGKYLSILSMCSLEIYYVQMWWINCLKDIVFPVNWLSLVVSIVTSAYFVHYVSELVLKRISTKLQL